MASATATELPPAQTSQGSDDHDSGPTSSPLLFFVALGFGVVFTNLWIIVGVKYCFRYNQRNRQARAALDGETIDLNAVPRPHRRRREKKLMTMEEVNERFPLTKYKTWKAGREQDGLPTAGGITTSPSRAPSVKDVDAVTATNETRRSGDTARPGTAHSSRDSDQGGTAEQPQPQPSQSTEQQGTEAGPKPEDKPEGEKPSTTAHLEKVQTAVSTIAEPNQQRNSTTTTTAAEQPAATQRQASTVTDGDETDDDDPIRTAAAPEMLGEPGDTCAICLETIEDDEDVRGLTCGHAFHASCVDPWLTSRRACCPLCKADYYVPKPRAENFDAALAAAAGVGPADPNAMPTGRRNPGGAGISVGGLRVNLPSPPQVWIGSRTGFSGVRPRMLWLVPSSASPASPAAARQSTGARSQAAVSSNNNYSLATPPPPSGQSANMTGAASGGNTASAPASQRQGRRARLFGLGVPRLPRMPFRGDRTGGASPGELEAGRATQRGATTTTS
ncbi:hypothetical protein BDY21DRAFT_375391 [Lineolata rhizophorae]|uniref:RING-type domain-containing protein n=1 Tax=Lineolata rhizophorae TaxID=578093 RepID=A0A6A6NLZ9_9PEZI|nr:hypothetical protein BDY21DRAFT_375391 [Lineolata rhizophorae]